MNISNRKLLTVENSLLLPASFYFVVPESVNNVIVLVGNNLFTIMVYKLEHYSTKLFKLVVTGTLGRRSSSETETIAINIIMRIRVLYWLISIILYIVYIGTT